MAAVGGRRVGDEKVGRTRGEPADAGMTLWMLFLLGLVGWLGPFAVNLYLPGLPRIGEEFGASATTVQLTMTTYLAGLALGQMVAGPLSDKYGRRPLLLWGSALCLAASVLCAVSGSVAVLVAARALQGAGASAGLVLSRAIVMDVAAGPHAIRTFSMLMAVQGLAPVIAPSVGGLLFDVAGWRAAFWSIAALSAVAFVGAAVFLAETLPPERRRTGGVAEAFADCVALCGNRSFVGLALTFGLGFSAMMTYIASSPFVVQVVLGMSPVAYSLVFTVNAGGMLAVIVLNRVFIRIVRPVTVAVAGLAALLGGAVLLLTLSAVGTPTVPMLAAMWVSVAGVGAIIPNLIPVAVEHSRPRTGTGAALVGSAQFGLASVVAPLGGVAGEGSAVPMALTMLGCASLAIFSLLVVVPERIRDL